MLDAFEVYGSIIVELKVSVRENIHIKRSQLNEGNKERCKASVKYSEKMAKAASRLIRWTLKQHNLPWRVCRPKPLRKV